jgi:hypothetical protein
MKRKWNLDVSLKPLRNVEWGEEDGKVVLKVEKFKSRAGRWFCKVMKRPEHFYINLDEVGSFIWKRCDGEHTLEDILEELEEKYGGEMMKERLGVFIYILQKYGYVSLEK